jgi:hypothetical protein
MDKKYRTRDGREVRLYAVDGATKLSVHGAIKETSGWIEASWDSQGRRMAFYDSLVEVKTRHKRTVWVNAYVDNTNSVYGTKERADGDKHLRIACIKVELDFEEGEGL